MSSQWESTVLLRVAGQAYLRAEHLRSGDETRYRQAQDLVECGTCHRTTDWLLAAVADGVDIACRCGRGWRLAGDLRDVVGLAEFQPIEPRWECLDDACRELGFSRRPHGFGGVTRNHHGPSLPAPPA